MNLSLRVGPPHGDERTSDLRRQREIAEARRNGWPELNHDDLVFNRFFIEHKPTAVLYVAHRGEQNDALYTNAAAWYLTDAGGLGILERPPKGFPQTVAELDARLAKRTT